MCKIFYFLYLCLGTYSPLAKQESMSSVMNAVTFLSANFIWEGNIISLIIHWSNCAAERRVLAFFWQLWSLFFIWMVKKSAFSKWICDSEMIHHVKCYLKRIQTLACKCILKRWNINMHSYVYYGIILWGP